MTHSGEPGPDRRGSAVAVRRSCGHGRHEHLCWSYGEPSEFTGRAGRFLADGLALGQRVRLVGAGDADALTALLRGTAGLGAALDSGAAQVVPPAASHAVTDPEALVAAHAAATEEALADGYTGLRVVAEATALVRTPAHLAALLRYEYLVDRYMVGRPFAAMCGYDRAELGEDVMAQLVGVHPRANRPGPFRLHAGHVPDAAVQLGGELDFSGDELLATLLARVDPEPSNGEFVVHAPDLTFIDHHGLLTLAAHARRRGATAVLRTGWAGAARVVALLDLPDVRVEPLS
ncbi:MEDS domain-containing protein [Saccharothrix australiensis]|uniref:DcmR-like sensory protein n=1 Tax=Saccharothrix australiensis TaxID=2072 RepID=A0A495VZT7_9PSEU|nr:MEDS domain-containing protein [Saccharothrix australiensis]RKT54400.1 DcmR-like sensory protein [Saccharothrix australiensis]